MQEAIAVTDEAIDRFEKCRDLLCAPDLWILKGDALLALGAADGEVEVSYQVALSLAQELGAKVSELRAATQLARLYQRQGRPRRGLQDCNPSTIGSVKAWTRRICAARALLDELGLSSQSEAA